MPVSNDKHSPNGLRLLTAPMRPRAVGLLLHHARRRLALRDPDTSGIAHFAEHMFFKGTESRPTARDIGSEIDGIGGEFNAFTGKEYTGYYVRCAGEHRAIALDVLVDMLRHSKFDPEEIDREKGVIIEEMNMYFDTPRDYISGVYDSLLYGDQPIGWDIIGRKETVRGATRDTFLGYIDQWYSPSAWSSASPASSMPTCRRIERLLGDLEPAETATPAPAQFAANGSAGQDPHEGVGPGAPVSRRPELPARPSGPLRAPAALDGPRDRHVVAALHRGSRAPRPRVLHLRDQPQLHGRGLALLAGRGRHRADRRGDHDDRDELKKITDEAVPSDELEKARNVAKGRFVLQTESPHGLIMFGLRREVLEGQAAEPEEILAGLDAVTAEDVQRVAQDVIGGHGLNLALIGPFEQDQQERFEKLLS